MLRGGIYGRSPQYPWLAQRTRRIFRRVIRIDLKRSGERWRERTANAVAFNTSTMVPVFAYEWRPKPAVHKPPPSPKTVPVHVIYAPETFKRAA